MINSTHLCILHNLRYATNLYSIVFQTHSPPTDPHFGLSGREMHTTHTWQKHRHAYYQWLTLFKCPLQERRKCSSMLTTDNYVLWNFLWSWCLHTEITLSFLVVGHTKFAPDWCFGLFKRLYRKTHMHLEGKCLTNCYYMYTIRLYPPPLLPQMRYNEAQLVVNQQGTVVPMIGFLAPYFKKLQGIKKGHHFTIKSANPGDVFVKDRADQTIAKKHSLLKSVLMAFQRSSHRRTVHSGICTIR